MAHVQFSNRRDRRNRFPDNFGKAFGLAASRNPATFSKDANHQHKQMIHYIQYKYQYLHTLVRINIVQNIPIHVISCQGFYLCIGILYETTEGSLEGKLPPIWTDEKAEVERVSGGKSQRREEKRKRKRKRKRREEKKK